MKPIRFHINQICFLLILSFLFQSCVIFESQVELYTKNPVTLEKALESRGIKIITTNEDEFYIDEFYFSEIFYTEDELHGWLYLDAYDTIEVKITESNILEIYILDQEAIEKNIKLGKIMVVPGLIISGLLIWLYFSLYSGPIS